MKRDEGREPHEIVSRPADEHVEWLLDQALEATFPASDPVSVSGDTRYPSRALAPRPR